MCTINSILAIRLTFGGPLSAVQLVYTFEITLGYRKKHVEDFSPNGQFVHLLQVLHNIDQCLLCVHQFKVEYSLIEGHGLCEYTWLTLDVLCSAYTWCTNYRSLEHIKWSMTNTLVQTASPYTSQKCIKIFSKVMRVYSHSNVQCATQLPLAN